MVSRRTLLRTGAAGLAAGLAGCRGDADPPTVGGTITSDVTWGDERIELVRDLTVTDGATITLEPGAELRAEAETYLRVKNGRLVANGTAQQPIAFRGDERTPGHWDGLEARASGEIVLSHARVAHAGRTSEALRVQRGRASITDTVVEQSAATGIRLGGASVVDAFGNNTLRDNARAGLSVDIDRLGALDDQTRYAVDNGYDHIQVTGSAERDATWPGLEAPYFLGRPVNIDAGITVAPGASFLMGEGSGISVDGGYLDVAGTTEAPVRFVGWMDEPGYWNSIVVRSEDPNTRFRHTEIADASTGLHGYGTVGVTDSTVRNNDDYGIGFGRDCTISAFGRNTFGGNGEGPVTLPAHLVGLLDGSNNFAGATDGGRIGVAAGEIDAAQSWPATAVPYSVDTVTVDDTLTIEAGATLEFREGAGVTVADGGALVVGADGDPVTVEGRQEAPGYWQGITIDSEAPATRLHNAEVGFAGTAVALTDGSTATITECHFHDSTVGIEVGRGATLSASGNTFENVETVRRG